MWLGVMFGLKCLKTGRKSQWRILPRAYERAQRWAA